MGSPRSGSAATTMSWASWMSRAAVSTKLSYSLRRHDLDLDPVGGVGGPGEGRAAALVGAGLVGPEPGVVGLARHGVELATQRRHVPAVDDVGGDQVQLHRGVDRDHQLVVGEGAVGIGVAPQPLLGGGGDLERVGALGWRRRRGADRRRAAPRSAPRPLQALGTGGRHVAGLLGEDDADREQRDREERPAPPATRTCTGARRAAGAARGRAARGSGRPPTAAPR